MLVYVITNLVNGKRYVGQTICTLDLRWRRHCWKSTAKGTKMPIASAIQKYGPANFSIQALCECCSQQELNERELAYALQLDTFYPNGYNITAGDGYGAASDEMKRRISIGKKGWRPSLETRKRMSLAKKGRKHTLEARQKRAASMQGKAVPPQALLTLRANIALRCTKLLSPSGEIVSVSNVAEFCRQRKLLASHMSSVIRGKRLSHKGWRLAV